ncbi:hypothetical protein BD289DRAFT_282230 [Coniella lustricola]|uniref:Uncharacterized protein n=1 Tax=Coniella lustricola TaxID=2025994 RepID=A0A2T3A5R4_9PEZI|nr:hypothetical protein BD289DRAFT_282230 [Coniella lustricola]
MFRQALSRNSARAWATPGIASAVASGEQLVMHRVKLQPTKGRFRKLATYCMVGIVSLYVWEEIAFLPLKHLDSGPLPKGMEEELEPLFIPLPFTEKQVQPPPYAGSEEEWQSFKAFSQNHELRQRVKDDLSTLVKKAAEKNMIVRRWAKKGEGFQLGPRWLIISYPERPPPECVRWGLEWNDEGLFLKEQNVDPRTQALIDRVLKPYPVANASYAFAKAMVKHNVNKVANFFGYQPGGNEINTSGLNPEVAKTLSKFASRQTADGNAATGSSTSASEPSAPSTDSEQPTAAKPEGLAKPDGVKGPGGPSGSLTKDNIPYYQSLVGKGSGPWMAFTDGYKRAWRPLKCHPPRGSIAVHGLIALESPKGRVYIDVFAWYHPKTDQFHQDSITMQLRSIAPHTQTPRR